MSEIANPAGPPPLSELRLAHDLAEQADRAARATRSLVPVNVELVDLMRTRSRRPWTLEELERYLELSRTALAQERVCRLARRRFDDVRRRLARTS